MLFVVSRYKAPPYNRHRPSSDKVATNDCLELYCIAVSGGDIV